MHHFYFFREIIIFYSPIYKKVHSERTVNDKHKSREKKESMHHSRDTQAVIGIVQKARLQNPIDCRLGAARVFE
jgi:hypothetical protein